jgi:hypothetical protein
MGLSSKKDQDSKKTKRSLPRIQRIYYIIGMILSVLLIANLVSIWLSPTTPKRADLQLIVIPNDDTKWDLSSNVIKFDVNITVSNVGESSARIKEVELLLMYRLPNGNFYSVPTLYENLSSTFGLSRDLVGINEDVDYCLHTELLPELYVDQNTGQIIQVGDAQAEKFRITVVYDDGKESVVTRTFSFE